MAFRSMNVSLHTLARTLLQSLEVTQLAMWLLESRAYSGASNHRTGVGGGEGGVVPKRSKYLSMVVSLKEIHQSISQLENHFFQCRLS